MGSRWAATAVRNDWGAHTEIVEDHNRLLSWSTALTSRFPRSFMVLNTTQFHVGNARYRSRTEEAAFHHPLTSAASVLINEPDGRLHWPTPFQISFGGHLAIPKSARV
jgi:hypothetical protein